MMAQLEFDVVSLPAMSCVRACMRIGGVESHGNEPMKSLVNV